MSLIDYSYLEKTLEKKSAAEVIATISEVKKRSLPSLRKLELDQKSAMSKSLSSSQRFK